MMKMMRNLQFISPFFSLATPALRIHPCSVSCGTVVHVFCLVCVVDEHLLMVLRKWAIIPVINRSLHYEEMLSLHGIKENMKTVKYSVNFTL